MFLSALGQAASSPPWCLVAFAEPGEMEEHRFFTAQAKEIARLMKDVFAGAAQV